MTYTILRAMSQNPTSRNKIERKCATCQDRFFTAASEIRRGSGLFCSIVCYKKRRIPIEVRFWKKVYKTPRCWIWTGARKQGPWNYGIIEKDRDSRRMELAHRVSWRLHHGEIPSGLCVLHRCDNPPCVRPEHLFLGTLRDNTQDMIRKGRARLNCGGRKVGAKLSPEGLEKFRRNRHATMEAKKKSRLAKI